LLEGMYSAAAGMAAQQERLDALSNDLANSNTAGYKHVRVAFRDLLYTATGAGAARGVSSGAGAAAVQMGRGSEQGAMQNTGNKLDVALSGQGFLQVRDRRGQQALTRDGALMRQANGRLVTSTGAWTGITVPATVKDDDLGIDPNGNVTANGQVLGRLRIVNVRAPENLQSAGDNLFRATAQSGAPRPVAQGATTVQQGVLEGSNVEMADTMTELVDAQRAFEFASKAITTQDRLLEIANQVKR
jgi:flagellar basal-body rod protein FlgG